MGIVKSQFDNILKGIFASGNTINLYSTLPSADGTGGTMIGGNSYKAYTIKGSDFSVGNGIVTSTENMMLYLCEEESGHGTAVGFGVCGSDNKVMYFGEFADPMPIGYNTVPTIKKYDEGKGEGIRITMTSTEANATSE